MVLMWGFDRMSLALYETVMELRPRTRRRVEQYRGTIAESLQRPDARRHRAFVLCLLIPMPIIHRSHLYEREEWPE